MNASAKWIGNVKRMGRTYWHNKLLWMAFSGSGIGFQVTGRRCVISLHGDSTGVHQEADTMCARYAVYVDDVRVLDGMMTDADREVIVFEGTEVRTARVLLLKLSESAMSTLAVSGVETDGELSPLPLRDKLVEFVGDSITCGYGIDTGCETDKFHTANEDVTKAYAWQTADLLGVDRSMVCLSGYGVLSGWTGDPNVPSPGQLVPNYYEKLGFSYALSDGERVEDWLWDFSQRQPDAVVINLGTNDASYTVDDPDKQAQYRQRYQAFLRQIRRCNPEAQLLCVLGVMGDVLYPSLAQAVAEYAAATGDERISVMHLEAIRPDTEGYVADFHPTVTTHTRVAAVVAQRLGELLG